MNATNKKQETIDPEALDQRAIKSLQASSQWLIKEATGKIYANPAYTKIVTHDLIKQFQVSLENTPALNSHPTILRYMPSSRGIRYDIELLQHTTYNNERYEYWRIFVTSEKWATKQIKQCYFLVTKARTQTETRTVLQSSPQFFHRYQQGDTTVLTLDFEKNLALRYKLSPWYFTQCYTHYPHLTKEKVIVLRNGSYQTISNN
ncbi:MAG: hypothetical protein KAG20_06370 [Cocleimonas sp.]|nr:hypothetical protein [Cocleimonas sp.]